MQFIFTRHGESDANVAQVISNRDLPHHLTSQGRKQAHALADMLMPEHIGMIYTSPILRARQTAQIIAEKRHVPVHTTDALREFDCGIMEGRGDAEAWQAYGAVVQAWEDGDYDRRIDGGESYHDLCGRFVPFIARLISECSEGDDDIVLLSHGGLLSQMLPQVLSNIDRTFANEHLLGNCGYVTAVPHGETLLCKNWDSMLMA